MVRAGMGQKGCRHCKKVIPRTAQFCGYSCRSAYTIAKTGDRNAKARAGAVEKAKERRLEKEPRAKKSDQTKRLEAFYTQARAWYWAEVEKYADHYSRLGVPALNEIGATVCGMFSYGGCWGGLSWDHVGTRNDKDPAEAQTLCMGHNRNKGSRHGGKWDFRSERFKAWLIEARERDWELVKSGSMGASWNKRLKVLDLAHGSPVRSHPKESRIGEGAEAPDRTLGEDR